jgi:hypothetical protein
VSSQSTYAPIDAPKSGGSVGVPCPMSPSVAIAGGSLTAMRVLLTEGSGLTSRQVAGRLGALGHEVHVVSADPLCLARWTRHVRKVHAVPAYGREPFAWLDATLSVLRSGFDVLLPTQEQVALLALEADRVRELGVALAVPPFEAVLAVQDKLAAFGTLRRLRLPQPVSVVAANRDELLAVPPPVYVKTPIGTATAGVRWAPDRAGIERTARELGAAFDDDGGVLVQRPARGRLAMVQAVFSRGRLVAWHANVRVREGANGGASNKRSVALPGARDHVERLGKALAWNGALSLDAVLTDDGPLWIDVNPRLVEPGNALRAGVDLVEALLAVSAGSDPAEAPGPGAAGIATHQLLIAVLGAAQRDGKRRAVLRELAAAAAGRGPYRDSAEELTPVRDDPLAAVPVAAASAALLVAPAAWRHFVGSAVSNYALTSEAWRAIRARAELPAPPTPARRA